MGPLGTHGETVDPDVEERLIAQADQEEPDPELQAVATDTVSSLLHHRQSEVLKFLQTKGVHKLAEFDVEVWRLRGGEGWNGADGWVK